MIHALYISKFERINSFMVMVSHFAEWCISLRKPILNSTIVLKLIPKAISVPKDSFISRQEISR